MNIRYQQLIVVFFLLLLIAPATAQEDIRVLTVAMPPSMVNVIPPNLFDAFEERFTDVRVEIIDLHMADLPTDENNIYDPLIAGQAYVSAGDLLIVDTNLHHAPMIDVEQTSARFFLDLSPLIDSDPAWDQENFHPAARKAFRWSGATWAIPLFMDIQMLGYDPEQFAEANLQTPSQAWGLEDFIHAIDAFSERDTEGNIIKSGFYASYMNQEGIVFSLLEDGLVDIVGTEANPQISLNALEPLLKIWMESEELLYPSSQISDLATAPLVMGPMSQILEVGPRLHPAPLPGGNGPLEFVGIALSRGTDHPTLAYELAKYISNRPEILPLFGGLIPARQLFRDHQMAFTTPLDALEPEKRAMINTILDQGLPTETTQFRLQLDITLSMMSSRPDVSLPEVVYQLEEKILQRMVRAEELAQHDKITVNTPYIGEYDFKFGVWIPVYMDQYWEDIIEQFIDQEPSISHVSISHPQSQGGITNIDTIASEFDCFYIEGMEVQDSQLSQLYALDPLIEEDSQFNSVNFNTTGLFNAVQKEGHLWGVPLSVDPVIVLADPQVFELFASQDFVDWTINDFTNTLAMLSATTENPLVQSIGPNDDPILALVSAAGGLLFDYRTIPTTLDFTSPQAVSAVQRVLDLIRTGYIASPYVLTMERPSFDAPILMGSHSHLASIRGDYLPAPLPLPEDESLLVLPVTMGFAYISRHTDKVDACYSFISYLAQKPALFGSVPLYDFQMTAQAAGTGIFSDAFYGSLMEFMNRPDVLLVPASDNNAAIGITAFIRLWLSEILSAYIDSNDLETLTEALRELETNANQFQTCIYNVEFETLTPQQLIDDYVGCIDEIDPELSNTFRSQ